MSVSREEVLRVAALAELRVDAEHVDELTRQLNRILEYVAQLSAMQGDSDVHPFVAGPDSVSLRPDVVQPRPLADPPEAFAPRIRDHFFIVPRLPGLGDDSP